jgi:PKD repeat protein
VTDNEGAYDTLTKNIYVAVLPPIAFFDWSPKDPLSGETITFDASQSHDPDGTITLYQWDWDNDGNYDENHTTPTATHTYTEPGSYQVTLKVTDNDGQTGMTSNIVTIWNRSPVAQFDWTPEKPLPGIMIKFDASQSYDPDGSITLYQWDWDNDGDFEETNDNPMSDHLWAEPGNYTVNLRVMDNLDSYDTVTRNINITGYLITEADWGDSNYTGDKPGQYLTYKLQESHGYQKDTNKGWSSIEISAWFPMARNSIHKNTYDTFKTGLFTKLENMFFNSVKNKFLSFIYNNKLSGKGRNGQSWASIGSTLKATQTAQACISIKGSLKGNFWTDIKSESDIISWVDVGLHVVEKDLYEPGHNEGESYQLCHYDFNVKSENIDVILDNIVNVNLTEGKEYIVFLKLKTFSSLSPKIPIINGYRSKLDFGKDPSDDDGIKFSYIGIQYLT